MYKYCRLEATLFVMFIPQQLTVSFCGRLVFNQGYRTQSVHSVSKKKSRELNLCALFKYTAIGNALQRPLAEIIWQTNIVILEQVQLKQTPLDKQTPFTSS